VFRGEQNGFQMFYELKNFGNSALRKPKMLRSNNDFMKMIAPSDNSIYKRDLSGIIKV
jgi:hypothetical protein